MKSSNGHGNNAAQPPIIEGLAIVMLVTACVLLVPLAGMQFSDEVHWSLSDFVIAGGLVAFTGALYVLAARLVRRPRHRALIGAVLGLILVLTWIELAVGLFGSPFAGS